MGGGGAVKRSGVVDRMLVINTDTGVTGMMRNMIVLKNS
jgi:hypothetical protein